MERIITLGTGNIILQAVLNDTAAARAVWDTLPYEVQCSTWGDELYFSIPVELELELENGQDIVEVGDIGYWPVGNAFCIFYGPTPMSVGEEPRPASPVTLIGRLLGDSAILKNIRSGTTIFIGKKV